MVLSRNGWRPQPNCGYTLLYASAMSMLLLFSVMAYLKWSVSTAHESHRKIAEIQAYYTAQAAVIQYPIQYLRTHINLPENWQPVIAFNDGWIPDMGRFVDARIVRISSSPFVPTEGFGKDNYLCSATGIAQYNDMFGNKCEVRRRVFARVSRRNISPAYYFTDIERTRFDEFIWFFGGDSMFGRVHSNDDIGVHPGAYFGAVVTTAGRIYSPQGSTFTGLPRPGYFEHVKRIPIPVRADRLRLVAASEGNWLRTNDNYYTYGLKFNGSNAEVWQWRTGTPNPPYLDEAQVIQIISWSSNTEHAIFCDGELWVSGKIHGMLGIGAAGNLRIMDNLTYYESNSWQYPYTVNLTMHDEATLVSEAMEPGSRREDPWTGILIANTWANGRENGMHVYAAGGAYQDHRDIAIHGELFALNSSFTFEQQNDLWDPYRMPGTTSDERGYIFLTGGVCQHQRGYVHRANHNGTGYFKSYTFDPRWNDRLGAGMQIPPFQIDLSPAGGFADRIDGWYDDYANREDTGEAPYEQKYPPMNRRK